MGKIRGLKYAEVSIAALDDWLTPPSELVSKNAQRNTGLYTDIVKIFVIDQGHILKKNHFLTFLRSARISNSAYFLLINLIFSIPVFVHGLSANRP